MDREGGKGQRHHGERSRPRRVDGFGGYARRRQEHFIDGYMVMTALDLDRGQKLSAYATAGIPVYWIINLVDSQVEVYTGPGPGPINRAPSSSPARPRPS
jgi:Putative restriction endonuclease